MIEAVPYEADDFSTQSNRLRLHVRGAEANAWGNPVFRPSRGNVVQSVGIITKSFAISGAPTARPIDDPGEMQCGILIHPSNKSISEKFRAAPSIVLHQIEEEHMPILSIKFIGYTVENERVEPTVRDHVMEVVDMRHNQTRRIKANIVHKEYMEHEIDESAFDDVSIDDYHTPFDFNAYRVTKVKANVIHRGYVEHKPNLMEDREV